MECDGCRPGRADATPLRVVAFAKKLIEEGRKAAAKALNKAVRVLGGQVDPDRVINKIKRVYLPPLQTESHLLSEHGIKFDGEL